MCWDHDKKHLVVARKSGVIQLVDPKDGAPVTEFKHTLAKVDKVDTVFVGLFANSEYVTFFSWSGYAKNERCSLNHSCCR